MRAKNLVPRARLAGKTTPPRTTLHVLQNKYIDTEMVIELFTCEVHNHYLIFKNCRLIDELLTLIHWENERIHFQHYIYNKMTARALFYLSYNFRLR